MLVVVIASVCLGADCHDVRVTSSREDPTVNMQWCGNAAPPVLSAWLAENWPGYRLAAWRCQLGERRVPT